MKIVLVLIIIIIALILVLANKFKVPDKASSDDEIFIQSGSDDFLNVTLKGCLVVGKENIEDGYVISAYNNNISWFNAKNISYVGNVGRHGYMIVWKTTPDYYDMNFSGNVNLYILDFIIQDMDANCFVEYNWEERYVYGIILDTSGIQYSESDLIYGVLGLNKEGFNFVYSSASPSTSYTSTSSHYGGIDDSSSKIARDPDWYYDYYECENNPNIDDYGIRRL